MNRFNGLQWDAILGAELAKACKPEPAACMTDTHSTAPTRFVEIDGDSFA